MKTVFDDALSLMDSGVGFAYASVVETIGHTPRKNGSRMLVLEDGIVGTTGGGKPEFETIQLARHKVMPQGVAALEELDLMRKADMDSAYICGGKYRVMLFPVDPSDEAVRSVFETCSRCEGEGPSAVLFHVVDERHGEVDSSSDGTATANGVQHFMLARPDGGELSGQLPEGCSLPAEELMASIGRCDGSLDSLGKIFDSGDGVQCYAERVESGSTIYLFGCGHVGRETAMLAVHLGYTVVAMDDRAEFANEQNMPGCEVVLLDSFDEIPRMPIDANSHALVITKGHVADRQCVKWALDHDCGYIGLIGSKAKRDTLYQRLIDDGDATREQLDQVHAPVGIDIGAQTPAEIAVSIMAEIIACDAGAPRFS